MKNDKNKPRSGRTCKFCGKPTDKKGGFCSSDCEIAFLRRELTKKDERKNSEPRCYGRIEWGTCVQELYSTSSFDAKKRASDLRKLGFICEATRIKEAPIFSTKHNGIVNEQMTILTCFNGGDKYDVIAPPPATWENGLGYFDDKGVIPQKAEEPLKLYLNNIKK